MLSDKKHLVYVIGKENFSQQKKQKTTSYRNTSDKSNGSITFP